MENKSLKKDFSTDEIIKLLSALGSEKYKKSSKGELIFKTVCHHGSSYKLYYYPENKMFHCYTDCGDTFDIYELVKRSRGFAFYDAVDFINRVLGLREKKEFGFTTSELSLTDDWSIFHRYKALKKERKPIQLKSYPISILDYYYKIYPIEWLDEGINEVTMDKFNIRFDIAGNKIIIPQFDADGKLVWLRGRALDVEEVEAGKKYMPCIIENDFILNCPTQYVLYGLNENKEAIERTKKIVIFEAEKSVLKCGSYYGDNNFTVAVCGSNISSYHRDTILKLGVKEVIIAFDKEYQDADSEESYAYAEKILRLAYMFCPYITTYVLWDDENLIGYKDSPADRGKDILEQLMKKKYEVKTKEEEW